MARVIRMTTVIRDGMHNAFTDLQTWQGNYWVGYRKGAGHVSMDGEAVMAVSSDRKRFREIAHLHVPGDNRDPKLLPVNEQRLAVYVPSWTDGVPARKLQQYIAFSENGWDWEPPVPILEPQMWLWRIRPHRGHYYGLIQNLSGDWSDGNRPHELDLAVSDNLMEWEIIARIGAGLGLNESDIHFRDDGEAWIIARTIKETSEAASYFASARPPYTDWQVTPMSSLIHAPVMLQHDDQLYVAGRSRPYRDGETTFAPGDASSTSIWRVTRGHVNPVLRLPATGDCSYPGLIEDPAGRVCMSYYSQHAYHFGVVDPPPAIAGNSQENVADVYFAELDLT